jgi:hypothetical protein
MSEFLRDSNDLGKLQTQTFWKYCLQVLQMPALTSSAEVPGVPNRHPWSFTRAAWPSLSLFKEKESFFLNQQPAIDPEGPLAFRKEQRENSRVGLGNSQPREGAHGTSTGVVNAAVCSVS